VQDTADFNDPPVDDPIQEEVASTPAVQGNMESAKARPDLAARLRSGYIGTIRKFADRPNQRVPINPRLSRAEILGCPLEDVCEIEL
jgi:hypothetical protein